QFFRALKRAQRDLDLRPDRYTHYYKKEFPARYHAMMDTRRWGPGERLVFEPYTKEVYDETFKWIADHGIFADSGMGAGNYEEAVITASKEDIVATEIVPVLSDRPLLVRRRSRPAPLHSREPHRLAANREP